MKALLHAIGEKEAVTNGTPICGGQYDTEDGQKVIFLFSDFEMQFQEMVHYTLITYFRDWSTIWTWYILGVGPLSEHDIFQGLVHYLNMSYCESNITEQCVNPAGSEANWTAVQECVNLREDMK